MPLESSNQLRLGILGAGNVSGYFVPGIGTARRCSVVAVGSRDIEKARRFASVHHIAAAYGSYEELLADRNVDAVYVSVPNSTHHEWTIKALRAGKHVLCEKPMATTAAQAEQMFDIAGKSGKVLVEAFMYRSHPQTRKILDTIRSGAIGDVKMIKTGFCFRVTKPETNIRFKPELAGGAVMDVGCYCLSFCRLIAGQEPDRISASGKIHASGVDECATGSLHFPNGIVATFAVGMTVQADNTAYVCGTDGYLEIPWPWKPQQKASFNIAYATPPRQDSKTGAAPARPPKQEITVEAGMELYALEAESFAASVLDGAPAMVAPQESIGNMRVLDEIRKQIGLSF